MMNLLLGITIVAFNTFYQKIKPLRSLKEINMQKTKDLYRPHPTLAKDNARPTSQDTTDSKGYQD